jgi:hypothetical protein
MSIAFADVELPHQDAEQTPPSRLDVEQTALLREPKPLPNRSNSRSISPRREAADLLLISRAAHPASADTNRSSQLTQQWCAICHVTGSFPPATFSMIRRTFPQLHASEPLTSCALSDTSTRCNAGTVTDTDGDR